MSEPNRFGGLSTVRPHPVPDRFRGLERVRVHWELELEAGERGRAAQGLERTGRSVFFLSGAPWGAQGWRSYYSFKVSNCSNEKTYFSTVAK